MENFPEVTYEDFLIKSKQDVLNDLKNKRWTYESVIRDRVSLKPHFLCFSKKGVNRWEEEERLFKIITRELLKDNLIEIDGSKIKLK